MGVRRGSCKWAKAASYRVWAWRGKERIQKHKNPAIPRDDKFSYLVEGTTRDWLKCFLSKVMALRVEVIVSLK